MTEVRKGRMFLVTIRLTGVPRHLEAREYSRSRMIKTWVRMKNATPNQPVIHMARTRLQKPAPRM